MTNGTLTALYVYTVNTHTYVGACAITKSHKAGGRATFN